MRDAASMGFKSGHLLRAGGGAVIIEVSRCAAHTFERVKLHSRSLRAAVIDGYPSVPSPTVIDKRRSIHDSSLELEEVMKSKHATAVPVSERGVQEPSIVDGATRDEDKFVLTVRFNDCSFKHLNALRQRYFPPERNFISAHLTLFHSLSKDHCNQLLTTVSTLQWRRTPLVFLPPVSIGRGVAIPVACGELELRKERITKLLGQHGLTRQDRQPLRPHVTVQNKVAPRVAQVTLVEINSDFSSWSGFGLGLELWRYLGGPWSPHAYIPFLEEGCGA